MELSFEALEKMNSFRGLVVLLLLLSYRVADNSAQEGIRPSILGGENATLGQFPYQVSMIRYNQHWCGASLISQNYVLTASHCATEMQPNGSYTVVPAADIRVRAGSIHINSGGLVVNVTEVTVHPDYDFPNYDVTLLKLATPIEYTDNIKAIPLAYERPPTNSPVVASGWGYLSTVGPNPEILQYVTLTTITDRACGQLLQARRHTVFCGLHAIGEGICQGDSGGPGAYNGTLAGVVSFTPGACESYLPDGFAKVWVLYDWITENSDLSE